MRMKLLFLFSPGGPHISKIPPERPEDLEKHHNKLKNENISQSRNARGQMSVQKIITWS